jgi:hypothetical protein
MSTATKTQTKQYVKRWFYTLNHDLTNEPLVTNEILTHVSVDHPRVIAHIAQRHITERLQRVASLKINLTGSRIETLPQREEVVLCPTQKT